MVIRQDDAGILCIGQAAHAWVSGQMARCWGNQTFARPEPFEEVCLAAEQHDVGMAEWDAHPELNPSTQRPMAFTEMPVATHLALWRRAPHKVLTQSPYAALLISMHGAALYAHRDTPEVLAYKQEQRALQDDITRRANIDPAEASRNQQLLWAFDYLSIAPLAGWLPGSVDAPEARLTVKQAHTNEITVDPWPFGALRLTFNHWGRRLTQPATTQSHLDNLLEAAPWERLTLTWRPESDAPVTM
jgi:uncharacterized protein DUF3891